MVTTESNKSMSFDEKKNLITDPVIPLFIYLQTTKHNKKKLYI